MNKKIETKLIECHILMSEALKAYEDRAVQSNKLYELKQYSDQLPDEMNKKITVVLIMAIYGVAVARTATREIGKINYKQLKEQKEEMTANGTVSFFGKAGVQRKRSDGG